ncbi:OmpA family protein [uncultured Alistipes sp.]|uniref:OmpA family protein n=1 Tax=uncultured Alistipes sp. TaxID=538949 RepID=UPI001F9E32B3|nr:OmpA family protein [uncultured Alistipes sp.]HJC26045.1 OmpA family protein [Candidatus Alistipes stercoravium]
MKKIYSTILLLALASAAWAQETPKKPSWSGFVSNGFWDNWEISVGAGTGTALSNGKNYGSFGDRLGFEGNVSLLKWIHPVAGVRGQLQGGWSANYDAADRKTTWPYMFAHVDFMLNASNWFGGYRADRAWYAVPFAGFGYAASNFTDKSKEDNGTGARQSFAFTCGLLNKFRVSPSIDIQLELKGMVAKSSLVPAAMSGSYLFGMSATAGIAYRFNNRGWVRGLPGYTAEDIEAFQDLVAAGTAALVAAEAENEALAGQLQKARAEAKAAKAAAAAAEAKVSATTTAGSEEEAAFVSNSIILYNYSMSTLTPQEMTRLDLIAEQIKAGPRDRVYTIQGHADQQTGTKAGNKRVAENRAKRVYDYLVQKGVNPKQLTYQGLGDEKDLFNVQKANRAAIIK